MAGWLDLHGISAATAYDLMPAGAADHFDNAVCSDRTSVGLNAAEAWVVCGDAFAKMFPSERQTIRKIQTHVETLFERSSASFRQPYTFHPTDRSYPEVSLDYQDCPADLLAMAHEFGHTLQIVVTGKTFMPPVVRETCAFIAELGLLAHHKTHQPDVFKRVQSAWYADNAVYLVKNGKVLREQLGVANSPYDYRWNYPIARLLALHLFSKCNAATLWSIFEGARTLGDCLTLSGLKNLEMTMENYLPPVPVSDPEKLALNAYRSLGVMALLDIDYWQGCSEKTTGDYYQNLLAHLQSQTAHIALDDDRKPIGYGTWEDHPEDRNQVVLTRQAAPFGDHLALQKSLQSRLEGITVMRSRHTRSARSEQRAW